MSFSKLWWRFRQLSRRIWVRIALISALALISAGVSKLAARLLPDQLSYTIDAEAAEKLLSILTNSMLTVATFSLSVMVAAHHYAASQVTPRSHRLLRQDSRTQTALATFIGAFVYALVSQALLNAGYYTGSDFIIVYGVTIFVIALVIAAIVRWIQHLTGLGSMEQTTERVETATRDALKLRMETPCLGGRPLTDLSTIPDSAHAVGADQYGYVQYVDTERLSEIAETQDFDIYLDAIPGYWASPGDPLMWIGAWGCDEKVEARLRDALGFGDLRSFDQDPQFGLTVMSEIAQRALSPGINDPRTATDVILSQLRILDDWRDESLQEGVADPRYPRLHIPPMAAFDMVIAAFDHIARDGASLVEVQMDLQKVLRRLTIHDSPSMREAARLVSRRALAHSDNALLLAADRARVRAMSPHADADAAAAV